MGLLQNNALVLSTFVREYISVICEINMVLHLWPVVFFIRMHCTKFNEMAERSNIYQSLGFFESVNFFPENIWIQSKLPFGNETRCFSEFGLVSRNFDYQVEILFSNSELRVLSWIPSSKSKFGLLSKNFNLYCEISSSKLEFRVWIWDCYKIMTTWHFFAFVLKAFKCNQSSSIW